MHLTRRSTLLGVLGALGPASAGAQPSDAITAYEARSGGHVGLYAENVASGATLAWRADERFVMCSTFKASLAALVLRRVDRGLDHLDRPIAYTAADIQNWHAPVAIANLAKGALSVGAMCEAAVQESDNTCANLLLAQVGGPPALTAFWRACGDGISRLDDPEPFLNRVPLGDDRDTTTPKAMAGNLKRFVLGDSLSQPSRLQLKAWLIGSVTGFHRLRAGLPGGWVVGDKTGNNGEDAAGDIALTWPDPSTPIIICAYTRGGTPTASAFESLFAALGSLAARRLG